MSKSAQVNMRIEKLKGFLQLWKSFYDYFRKAQGQEPITEEDEEIFMEIKSTLAQEYWSVSRGLIKDPSEDNTVDVISSVISLKGIREMPIMQVKRIESGWHRSYIRFNTILGMLINEGLPSFAARRPHVLNKTLLLTVGLVIVLLLLGLLFSWQMRSGKFKPLKQKIERVVNIR